jgi:hypothetical protein
MHNVASKLRVRGLVAAIKLPRMSLSPEHFYWFSI